MRKRSLINLAIVLCLLISILGGCGMFKEPLERAKDIYRDKPEEAIEIYLELLNEDMSDLDALDGLAKVYKREEEFEELYDLLLEIMNEHDEYDDPEEALEVVEDYIDDLETEELSERQMIKFVEKLEELDEEYGLFEDGAYSDLNNFYVNSEEDKAIDIAEAADVFSIGLVTDVGGINDGSFNQVAWEGIMNFSYDYGSEIDYVQSSGDSDYIPNLAMFAEEGKDLILAPGFLFGEAIDLVANSYPDQKFAILDMVSVSNNVASVVFAEEEGAFLVGLVAGVSAIESGYEAVGFVGGYDFELIQKYEAGFEAGVKTVDPNLTVLVEYANDFVDMQKGQMIASNMYDQGAHSIYNAAGNVGRGIINEAIARQSNGQNVWAIGNDVDQYEEGLYDGKSSAVLTSMVKRLDTAAYHLAGLTKDGQFPGGEIVVMDLSMNGMSLPEENPNLSSVALSVVKDYRFMIADDQVMVPTVPERLK